MMSRKKGQMLLNLMVCLALLLTFALNLNSAASSERAPVTISPLSNSYALLPAGLRVNENLRDLKAARSEMPQKPLAQVEVASLWTYRYSVASLRFFLHWVIDSFCKRDIQQVCRLLDIPPPAPSPSAKLPV